jgi:hypothetical protein
LTSDTVHKSRRFWSLCWRDDRLAAILLAPLYAYLGVAYATEALSSANQGEPSRLLREKAQVQFRLAVSAQRNYQLSPRLVSPRIPALFE